MAGVCGGLGEYFGVDPVLFRVIVVVLAVFGGWGLLLYLLAWALIPEAPAPGMPPGSAGTRSRGVWWLIGVIVIALVVLPWLAVMFGVVLRQLWWRASGGYADVSMPMTMPWHLFRPGPGSLLLLVGAGLVIWWLLRRDNASRSAQVPTTTTANPPMGTVTPDTAIAAAGPTTAYPTAVESTVYPAPGQTQPTVAFAPAAQWHEPVTAPVAPPPPRRPRSVLGPLTVSVAALVAGVLLALDTAGRRSIPASVVLASTLAVVALGLVIGTWAGRSRGLIVLGVLLSMATAAVAALPSVDLSGGVGNRSWTVQTVETAYSESPYRLGIGHATLDVVGLSRSTGITHITASVGVGNLTVYVPRNIDLIVNSHVALGSAQWLGPRGSQASGRNVSHVIIDRPHTTTEVVLDLSVNVGQITVIPQGRTR